MIIFFSNLDNPTSAIPICLGKSFAWCSDLPEGLNNVAGLFELECSNGNKIASLPYIDNIIKYFDGAGSTYLDFVIPVRNLNKRKRISFFTKI